MVEVVELRKRFGEIEAVAGLSFTIERGQTLGLLGPNGSGKTTTISMICGLLKPDDGTVAVDNQSDPTSRQVRFRVGIAPQNLALYEELTAQENLAFFAGLYQLRGRARRERVDWALEFAELTERRRHRVKTFSGGMKRRLNLAAAVVHDPQVLLLDEPTVGVDPQSRNHLFERIESLREEGRTILYTTHYMEEAERLCDRVAIMDHGRILAEDSVSGLIEQHGGRSVVRATLTKPPADPSKLPGRLEGLELRFESERPLEDVGELAAAGLGFRTLEVARPDLETVFLSLTGRSLRD